MITIEQIVTDNTKIIGGNSLKIKSNTKISAKQTIIDNSQIIDLPRAEINIFDSEFYLNRYPDVAQNIAKTDKGISFFSVAQSIAKTDKGESFISVFPDLSPSKNSIKIKADTGINSTKIDSLLHYVEFGAQQGRDPSPLFDSQYYREQNSDVAKALAGGDFRGDPLLHYVKTGAQEGRDPNPFFDSDYYLTTHTDVADEGMNPLEHYVLFGAAEGRDPSPKFDPDFYLNQYTDVAAEGVDPLTHFLTFGQAEGRSPTPE